MKSKDKAVPKRWTTEEVRSLPVWYGIQRG